jgi:uncharacterized protein
MSGEPTRRPGSDGGADTAGPAREEWRFPSGDGTCAATLYRPASPGGDLPCVVMANGGGMTRRDGTPRFAERFAQAGMAALTFDARHLGDSDGEPRQLLDPDVYRADLAAAVAFARTLEGIDPDRVALWGFSYGGGVAIRVAADDDRLAAAVAMCPVADGFAYTLNLHRGSAIRLAAEAARAALGRRPVRAALVGPPGSLTLVPQPEAREAMDVLATPGSRWRNEMRAMPSKPPARFRPVRHAHRVRCPLLVTVGAQDTIAPLRPMARTADRAPRGELRRYQVNHFGGFLDGFEELAGDQLEFLSRHLARARSG